MEYLPVPLDPWVVQLNQRSSTMMLSVPAFAAIISTSVSFALTIRSEGGQLRTLASYGFASGNTTFNVSASPWPGIAQHPSMISAEARGRIVFVEVTTVTVNVANWANACDSNGCVGLVFYARPSSLLRTVLLLLAWSYWVPNPGAISTLPVCTVVDELGTVVPSDLVTMTADMSETERNPAAVALMLPSTIAFYGFVAVVYALLSMLYFGKLLQFVVNENGRLRKPPLPAAMTLCFFMLGYAVHSIRACNLAWSHEQGFSYPVLILFRYADCPLIAAGRTALALISTGLLEQQVKKRWVTTSVRFGFAVGLFATVGIFAIVGIATVTQVLPMGIVALYLIFLSHSIVYTVKQGISVLYVVRGLTSRRRQVGHADGAQTTGRKVAARLCATWTVATITLASHVVVLAVQNTSPLNFLIAFGISQVVGLISGSALLTTFHPKPSAVDRYMALCAWKRNVRPNVHLPRIVPV